VEELDKKATYYNLIRSSKKSYYLSNLFTAIISTVLISFVAILLFVIVCLGFGVKFTLDRSMIEYFSETYFQFWIVQENSIPILIIHIAAFIMFSIPWGVLSLAVSIISKNKYIIIASPFIFFIATSYITEICSIPFINPGLMLLKGPILKMPYGGSLYVVSYQTIFVLLFSLFYYIMSKRRFLSEGI
jgi:hypothetical protein